MKRNRIEIISQILDTCVNGANKTRIVYQANLNFRSIDNYLGDLIKNDLIKVCQEEQVIYRLTPKGVELLKKVNMVNDMLSCGTPAEKEIAQL